MSKKRYHFTLDTSIVEAVEKAVEKLGTSKSVIVGEALKLYLQNDFMPTKNQLSTKEKVQEQPSSNENVQSEQIDLKKESTDLREEFLRFRKLTIRHILKLKDDVRDIKRKVGIDTTKESTNVKTIRKKAVK